MLEAVGAEVALSADGRTLAVGYADGVVRVLTRCKDGRQRKKAVKPHTVPVTALEYSPDGTPCKICPAGTQTNTGATGCETCPAGTQQPSPATTPCAA